MLISTILAHLDHLNDSVSEFRIRDEHLNRTDEHLNHVAFPDSIRPFYCFENGESVIFIYLGASLQAGMIDYETISNPESLFPRILQTTDGPCRLPGMPTECHTCDLSFFTVMRITSMTVSDGDIWENIRN